MSARPDQRETQTLQEDASGWQTFKYGKLGEVVENIRTFALPYEFMTYTFKMQYEYDSWNRIQSMTYPDGEVVGYGYDKGGMLNQVWGDKGGAHYPYIDGIRYNCFGLKEAVFYGNGTRTIYEYDELLRLKLLVSDCLDGTMQEIRYDYDEVGNITDISNIAGMLPNGLGGIYHDRYAYDNLYRLVSDSGDWYGDPTRQFNGGMTYSNNGRILKKYVEFTDPTSGTPMTVSNYYDYPTSSNKLANINGHDQYFDWDQKGNMIFHHNDQAGFDRSLCWDEQNRLLGVADHDQRFSYYLYDANGDRTYKFTGDCLMQNLNGRWQRGLYVDHPTLYASPYLVATPQGYTKHYYAESERIASRVGGGMLELSDSVDYPTLSQDHQDRANNLFDEVANCLKSEAQPQEGALYDLKYWTCANDEETDCYWYHPDHLGSSSWITYTDGSAVQHLHYMPWGEDFVDQRTTSWHATYTFSAKERDSETGLSYFGSRYYSSDLSIWLSVDPMSDKYASTSPYAYCRNNPIILYDPDGMSDGWVIDKNDHIYWDENAVDQRTTKHGDTFLGMEGQYSIGTTVLNCYSNGKQEEQKPVIIDGTSQSMLELSVNTNQNQKDNQIDKIDNTVSTIGLITSLPIGAAAQSVVKTSSTIALKGLGGVFNIATVIPDVVRWKNNPTIENKRKMYFSIAGATISLIPVVGPVGSVIWNAIDMDGGFDKYYKKETKTKKR